MCNIRHCSLPALLLFAACSSHSPHKEPIVNADSSLRDLATRASVDFGVAVNPTLLTREPRYARLLARECTVLVAENHMKMKYLQPQRGIFNFSAADTLLHFAEQHRQRLRGHTLVWHFMPPDWLESNTWTRAELLDVMRTHITTVMRYYKGRVYAWDVVNEAVADTGGLRSSLWFNVIGPDYLDIAFQCAHAADPDALLFYNDYGAEGLNIKSDEVYALVRGMQERGVPIHGVGLQCHWKYDDYPPLDDVVSNITRLAALGLEIHITELDLRIDNPVTPEQLERQAQAYREIVSACLRAPRCTTVITWGISDAHSWVPFFFKNTGAALPFDEHYQPKPAYFALRDALASLPIRPHLTGGRAGSR